MRENNIIDKATCLVNGKAVSFGELEDGASLKVEGILASTGERVSIEGFYDGLTHRLVSHGQRYGIIPEGYRSTEHSMRIRADMLVGELFEVVRFKSPDEILELIDSAIAESKKVRLDGYVESHYRYGRSGHVTTSPIASTMREGDRFFVFTRNSCYELS